MHDRSEHSTWSDAALMERVRQDPPDEVALDVLVDRYWAALYGRCQMLTLDRQKASDLAQEAWCRILRARGLLRPEGNFIAYLKTVATNLWRDRNRAECRAGPMSEQRLESLDASALGENGESVALGDLLPDLNAGHEEERARVKLDIDAALERLSPQFREVVMSRYLDGESASEIGRRFGRTEQTITAWLREALRQMKAAMMDSGCAASGEPKT